MLHTHTLTRKENPSKISNEIFGMLLPTKFKKHIMKSYHLFITILRKSIFCSIFYTGKVDFSLKRENK